MSAIFLCGAQAVQAQIVGQDQIVAAREEDTFASLGETYGKGFVALRAANPDVNPWVMEPGHEVILPGAVILPQAAKHEGIVINIAEMRLYDFTANAPPPVAPSQKNAAIAGGKKSAMPAPKAAPVTVKPGVPANSKPPRIYAIGIGREGLTTPVGQYVIGSKAKNPVWRPTPRMREEDPKLPAEVPPGPDNPLGKFALYIKGTEYRIHGTNKPYSLGRRASSGCIRLYDKDIAALYAAAPVGTPVQVISEPIKVAVKDGAVFLEAHPDEDMADDYENDYAMDFKVPDGTIKRIEDAAGDLRDKLDWEKIRDVLLLRPGYPVSVML